MKRNNLINIGLAICLIPLLSFIFSCDTSFSETLKDYFFENSATVDITPPGNVSISSNIGNKTIKLAWVNPTDTDFKGIEISCSPAEGSLATPIVFTDKTRTSYDVTELTNGTTYTFTIKTFDITGNYSTGVSLSTSPRVNIEGVDNTPPSNVTIVSTTEEDAKVSFSWTNPSDTDFAGVELSSSPAEGSLATPIEFKDKTRTSYEVTGLTNEKAYSFTIKTFDTTGNYSGGLAFSLMPKDTTPPGDVYGLTAEAGNKYIHLTWQNPTNADFNGVKITASPALVNQPIVLSKEDKQYTVTNLQNDTEYTFTVTAVDTSGNLSSGVNTTATPKQGEGLTSTDLFTYKLDKSAYDFGYCASATTKTITITAASDMNIISNITNISGSGSFNINSISTTTVTAGENFTVNVTYTPSATSWDEADLSLCEDNSFVIRLIGSGFKQPKNVGSDDSLRLWLRSDLIEASSLLSETSQIKCLPDYSGNGFNAYPADTVNAPQYTTEGINGLPSMVFSNSRYLVSEGTVSNPIVKQSQGTTTFVIFKVTANSSTQSIVSANSGTTQIYPNLMTHYRYYGTSGYGSIHYGIAVYGYGYGGSYRYLFEKDSGDDNQMETLQLNTPYSICMKYDGNVDSVSPDPNTWIWQNGIKKFISFTYSNSSSTYALYQSIRSPMCYGSYGEPISDGKGSRYEGLGNDAVNTPNWETAKDGHATRPNDFAYSYTPYTVTPGASGATYFTNKVSNNSSYNGTIKTMFIGPNQTTSTVFIGQIAEVIVYKEALSEADIDAVNNYIYYRYNIGSAH